MPKQYIPPTPEQRNLAALREHHLEDAPSEARRRLLLTRLEALQTPNAATTDHCPPLSGNTRPSGWFASTPNHTHTYSHWHQTRRLALRGTKLVIGAAMPSALFAGVVVAGALLIRKPATPEIHPELQLPRTTPQPLLDSSGCIRGSGSNGLLANFAAINVGPGDFSLPRVDGREGRWFHGRSKEGAWQALSLIVEQPEVPQLGSGKALKIAGPATRGLSVNAGIALNRCYDASAYSGVSLRVRGKGALFVNFQTLDSIPIEHGGRCRERCWFTPGQQIVLRDHFETHDILWRDLSSPNLDYEVAKELMQIAFSIQPSDEPYELWLDNIKFLETPR